MEYAYSLKTERVKEKDFPYNGTHIDCTSKLVNFAQKLKDSDTEKMMLLYLDAQNNLIGIHVVVGTLNQAVVYPREVFKHALLHCAAAIIMIHNHPSGFVRPSDCDIRLTNKVKEVRKELDILLHDHLIVAEDRFYSMREDGLL